MPSRRVEPTTHSASATPSVPNTVRTETEVVVQAILASSGSFRARSGSCQASPVRECSTTAWRRKPPERLQAATGTQTTPSSRCKRRAACEAQPASDAAACGSPFRLWSGSDWRRASPGPGPQRWRGSRRERSATAPPQRRSAADRRGQPSTPPCSTRRSKRDAERRRNPEGRKSQQERQQR